jgi:hypothetical protein
MASWAHRLDAAPRAEPTTTLNTRCSTPSLHSGCSTWPHLAITGHNVEPRHNNIERLRKEGKTEICITVIMRFKIEEQVVKQSSQTPIQSRKEGS